MSTEGSALIEGRGCGFVRNLAHAVLGVKDTGNLIGTPARDIHRLPRGSLSTVGLHKEERTARIIAECFQISLGNLVALGEVRGKCTVFFIIADGAFIGCQV